MWSVCFWAHGWCCRHRHCQLGVAAWFTIALGLSVSLFAIEGLIISPHFAKMAKLGVGPALIIAPWTLGFRSPAATLKSALMSALVIAFAVWEMMTDREVITWWHNRPNHAFQAGNSAGQYRLRRKLRQPAA